MEKREGSGFHLALKLLQDINQPRTQLECELAQETQELVWRYDDWQVKLVRRHKRQQAQMVKETDTTFQEVFSEVRLNDLMKLLHWCICPTVPLCYMKEALSTTMQQDEDIPATSTVPETESSQVLGPSNSPAHQTGTLPLPVHLLPYTPFVGTPQVGHPFAEFIADTT